MQHENLCTKRIRGYISSAFQLRAACIYQPLPHEQDVTQGQFFKQSLTGFNSVFFYLD